MANEEEQTPPAKKSLLVPILLLTNLLAIGGIVVVLVLGPKMWAEAAPPAEKEQESVESADLGPTVDIGNFTINLSDPGAPRYLKAVVKATVSSERTQQEVDARNPQLRDVVLSYLSSLMLKDTQGARAKQSIRENLRKRINNILRTGEVRDIFFTEFVTQ